ncbi:MAG: restriction endonuclease subunit S, partial [Staphylococcus sp.]|nr:restriction endonuclease subunit S [Staphylococcus sp.]
MTEQTNTPKLRFPEFKDEWKLQKLGNLAQFSKGKSLSKKDLNINGNPCILYGELYTKYGAILNKVYSKTSTQNDSLVFSKRNQILIPSSGETDIDIATATAIDTDVKIAIGGDLNIITPINSDGRFISLYINGKGKYNLAKYAQGKSVVHLYNSDIKKLNFYLPTNMAEQKKVGDFFSKLDCQIELEEKKLELLEQQKKGYMQKIFSQELRFKDDNGNKYPNWETKKLSSIATITRGLTYKPSDIRQNGVRVLRSSNILNDKFHIYKDDVFVDKNIVKIPLASEDDILITAANGSPKLVGKHALIKDLKQDSVAGGFMYLLKSEYAKFIQIWMNSKEYKKIITKVQGGNGSIGNLSRKDLEN